MLKMTKLFLKHFNLCKKVVMTLLILKSRKAGKRNNLQLYIGMDGTIDMNNTIT
jgi:hypothetical protein